MHSKEFLPIMKMYKPLAAFAAASLCLTGLSVGAAAAVADDSARSSYVPLKAFKKATNAEHEHDVYNVWHFDPDHNNIASLSSARNGIVFGAGANVLAMKGNGLDQEGATSSSKTDILDLPKSLKIVASST
ncbi:MAG: hypothetical protein J0H64_03130, partial [Actinobacteria bacterium]|nr:hypothetical protein [Actinomycetota bacterium]